MTAPQKKVTVCNNKQQEQNLPQVKYKCNVLCWLSPWLQPQRCSRPTCGAPGTSRSLHRWNSAETEKHLTQGCTNCSNAVEELNFGSVWFVIKCISNSFYILHMNIHIVGECVHKVWLYEAPTCSM